MKNNKNLDNLHHSCAHLLAAAVLELYPDAKPTLGPPIEDGFYYDFDFKAPISDRDLMKIDQKMRELVKKWESVEKIEVSKDEALKKYKDNEYKQELIQEFAADRKQITFYKSGDFIDLCKGGHVENPSKEIKYFKLLSIAGAYWRGSEKNKMLTRIYGAAFPSKEELDNFLTMREEAKKRDHRKLGKELELFLISNQVGSGLPIFMPRGNTIRELIENFLINLKKKKGYQFIWTPHIAKSDIYHTSGHWGKYDAMFNSMKLDEEEYVLKPMNCPHHFQYYLNKPRSYKDLPFRIAENGTVYRNEKSGEVSGLLRVRALTIDDTHTFIRYSQTLEELEKVLELITSILKTFGFDNYSARISTGDPNNPDKYLGKRQEWERAEDALKRAAKRFFSDISIGLGEAAFYGPKIDVMVKDSIGRDWQLSTVQLDYNQAKNFEMKYIDENGKEQYPAILHIAMIGSIERLIGILIEHYAGAFPLWLSPVQVKIIPISERHNEFAEKLKHQLEEVSIRTEVNEKSESMQKKIREAQMEKIYYMMVVGDKEMNSVDVSVRARDGKSAVIKFEDFVSQTQEKIKKRLP